MDDLAREARSRPDREAVRARDGSRTYAALDADVDLTARRLMAAGIEPGQPVASLLDRDYRAVVLTHAASRAGMVLAPLARDTPAPALETALSDMAAPVLVCTSRQLPRVEAAAEAAGCSLVVADAAPGEPARLAGITPSASALPEPGPDDTQALLWTSGTSGRRRGVRLTRTNFAASAAASRERLGLTATDSWYASLSLSHVGGLALVLRAAAVGCRIVLDGPFDARALVRAIDAGAVTHASLVPTMLRRLLDALGRRPPPPSLRCLLVGGAHTPRDLLDRAISEGLPVASTYGMTEACSQVATAPPELVRAKPGTVGPPLEGVEVRVSPDGEIQVRGTTLATGYVAADNALRGPDGWFATGDLGRLDEDGHLWVTGRAAVRIISGGVNVDPVEVEEVLSLHPSVDEAAVVGVPDPEWGERVVAVVVPVPGSRADAAELLAFAKDRLPPPARPRDVHVVDRLPRNANGKVDRAGLLRASTGRARGDSAEP